MVAECYSIVTQTGARSTRPVRKFSLRARMKAFGTGMATRVLGTTHTSVLRPPARPWWSESPHRALSVLSRSSWRCTATLYV